LHCIAFAELNTYSITLRVAAFGADLDSAHMTASTISEAPMVHSTPPFITFTRPPSTNSLTPPDSNLLKFQRQPLHSSGAASPESALGSRHCAPLFAAQPQSGSQLPSLLPPSTTWFLWLQHKCAASNAQALYYIPICSRATNVLLYQNYSPRSPGQLPYPHPAADAGSLVCEPLNPENKRLSTTTARCPDIRMLQFPPLLPFVDDEA
jgi:hypothetical protein